MTFDFVEPIVFAMLSVGVIAAGAAVVLINRITAAALLMAFTFLCMAGMFVLLGAETIAAFQVLIYVGAITVLILMCVELMLNAANLAFVAFSRRYGAVDERGSVFVVFVFVIAAAEVAVGLGIVLSAYRNRPVVDVDEIHAMKG